MTKSGTMENQIFNRYKKSIIKSLEKSLSTNYYSKIFCENSIDIQDIDCYEKFKQIPITTKENYRNNMFDFLDKKITSKLNKNDFLESTLKEKTDILYKDKTVCLFTSGSTGIPLLVFRSIFDNHKDYFILNKYRLKNGTNIFNKKFVWLWPISPMLQRLLGEKYFGQKKVSKYGFIFNMYSINKTFFRELFTFIKNNNICWITGPPSVLVEFTNYLLKNKISLFNYIKYIECHGEYLFNWQRKIIKEAFNLDPTSVYSSNEIQFMAISCSNNNLHIITENVFIELIKNNEERTEIIATKLNNDQNPLIRYQLGDLAEWGCKQCYCTLQHYPIIKLKAHRSNDFLITRDGKKIEPYTIADAIYFLKEKRLLDTEQFRVIQNSFNELYFEIKPSSFSNLNKKDITTFLSNYLSSLFSYKIKIILKLTKTFLKADKEMNKFKYFKSKVHL